MLNVKVRVFLDLPNVKQLYGRISVVKLENFIIAETVKRFPRSTFDFFTSKNVYWATTTPNSQVSRGYFQNAGWKTVISTKKLTGNVADASMITDITVAAIRQEISLLVIVSADGDFARPMSEAAKARKMVMTVCPTMTSYSPCLERYNHFVVMPPGLINE